VEIQSEFLFSGPRDELWVNLMDPAVLAKALPGTKLERVDEDRYVGEMEATVGPVTAARFDVAIELVDKVVPESFTMRVDGKGAAGFTKGTAHVQLAEQGPDETLMKYTADLQVGGRIAGVGQRLLDSVAKSMSHQGLEAINRHLQGEAPPEAAAPVQLLSRPVVLAIGIVVLAVLLVLLL
jgi:carbon monoxide dehydrogenase subunit G